MSKEVTLNNEQIIKLLRQAGKLAKASRLVTTANTKNLSQRIKEMEADLDDYDKEILFLSNDV
jgi:hypothetical protein